MRWLIAVAVLFLVGCGYTDTSDEIQNSNQERANLQAVQTVGMPAIHNFWEKRQLRDIYEKRDDAFPTTTYISDLQGHLHKVCDSVGYGIPYATQYSNPEHIVYNGSTSSVHSLPQAEPNGLYSPANANGTWVLCLGNNKTMEVTYIEQDVAVFPVRVLPQNVSR